MPERYSDAQLIVFLQKAARRINRVLCLTGTDEEIVVNTSTGEITPDDEDLKDLVLLQSECLISQTDYSNELSDGSIGVMVNDGEQTVDTRNRAAARSAFFDSPHSPCAQLESQLNIEKIKRLGNSSMGGNVIW